MRSAMSGTVAVRPQPTPYYPVVTRKSDDSMVRMIQKYRNQYGLPEQSAEEIRTALLDLSDYSKDSQFIVVYAADALELTLTSDSRSFRYQTDDRRRNLTRRTLSTRARTAFDIYWQLWLYAAVQNDRFGHSLEEDLEHILDTLIKKYRP